MTLAVVAALAGCGGGGKSAGTSGASTAAPAKGDPVAGKTAFLTGAEPHCGDCHTLADAGTSSLVASNLDELKPTYQQVLDALNEGPGAMPSYSDAEDQVKANIAAYVESATHASG